ncbi:MAG: hypothetical protein ACYTG1_06720 [Planctomycetota bacterium]|jgi:hypothetical protein
MDDDSRGTTPGACPHVDRNDPRCGSRFSLGRIDQAFCVCFGAFHGCPMYHRINRERADSGRRAPALTLVTMTAHGHSVPLRATGT